MPERLYFWIGRDLNAKLCRGKLSAANPAQVHTNLMAQRIRPLWVMQIWHELPWHPTRRVFRSTEVTLLTRQLHTLVHAGIPLFQALQILSKAAVNPMVQALAEDLHLQLGRGLKFHQALQRHAAFDGVYCHLIEAAEWTGTLETFLEQLATHREKADQLRRQIRNALFYPWIVLGVAGLVLSLLLWVVVPSFEQIFSAFNAPLPWLTQCVIALSHNWTQYLLSLLLWPSLALWGLQHHMSRHPRHRQRMDLALIHTPLIGRFIRQTCMARWTRTLATVFSAGIPLAEALEHIQQVTGHSTYALASQDIRQQLLQGHALSDALQRHVKLFSPMLVQMCIIGEESGALQSMLHKAADAAEQEVQTTVTQLAHLLEPTLMVMLGLVVGSLVLALYLPIFEMGQVV